MHSKNGFTLVCEKGRKFLALLSLQGPARIKLVPVGHGPDMDMDMDMDMYTNIFFASEHEVQSLLDDRAARSRLSLGLPP